MKIIHCADAHLGSDIRSLGHLGGKRKMEIRESFYKILALCEEEKADILFISGDLFDQPTPDKELVQQVIDQMEKIPETRIFIAPGNHDYICLDSCYMTAKWPENVTIFKGAYECVAIEELQVNVFGAAFQGVNQEIPLLKKKEEAIGYVKNDYLNLGVLHGDLVSSVTGSNYNPITVKQIENSGLAYLALGHIHLRSEVKKAGNTYYSYCGNHDGRGFDELGEKGVYVGEIKKNSFYELEPDFSFRKVGNRKYLEVKFEPGKQMKEEVVSEEEIAKALQKELETLDFENWRENLYKVVFTGDMPENVVLNPEGIKSWLSEVFFLKIKDKTRIAVDYDQVAKQRTLKGMFVAKMRKAIVEAESKGDTKKQSVLEEALSIGLKSFYTEVGYDVDQ